MHKMIVGQENIAKKELEEFQIFSSNKEEVFLFSLKEGEKRKIILFADGSFQRITCHLENNSSLILIYVGRDSCDQTEIYLEGEGASVQYRYLSLSKDSVRHEISVHHQANRTVSSLQNHGVNLQNQSMEFYINGVVQKGTLDCVCEQNNKIVEMSNGKSCILPNLFVDTDQVVANHSAYIGKFTYNELFYLTSRGISKEDSYLLLLKGVLLSKLPCGDEVLSFISDYYHF